MGPENILSEIAQAQKDKKKEKGWRDDLRIKCFFCACED